MKKSNLVIGLLVLGAVIAAVVSFEPSETKKNGRGLGQS